MNRVPPHDAEAEQVVLSGCLASSDLLEEVADILVPGMFYAQKNRDITEAIVALREQGLAADATAVGGWLNDRQKLQGVAGYLVELLDFPADVANIRQHAVRVAELSRLRQAILTCQRVAAEGYTEAVDVQSYLDGAEQAIYSLAHQASDNRDATPARDAVAEAFRQIAEIAKSGGGVTGTPSGFVELDELTTGYHPGELHIIAARPGMGKTSLVLNMVQHLAAAGEASMVFSLEMPVAQLAMRLLASEAMVDVSRLRSGRLEPADWARLSDAVASLSRAPLWLDDKPGLTVLDIRAKARRAQSELAKVGKKKLRLIAVDYLQLMTAQAQSREQEISQISRGLKQLSKDLEVPVIALSQLNRSVESRQKDKRPQLSDLRESGSIEQDADSVMFIYRDEYYHQDSPDAGQAELLLAKQRNGPTGKVMVRFDSAFTRFGNLPQLEGGDLDDFDAGF